MRFRSLLALGRRQIANALAEQLYLSGGPDWTRPIHFYALVNERCNARCAYCVFWRRGPGERMAELSIADWQRLLRGIKDFVGAFSISFSGGEPLLKKGFLDLLSWCGENDIHAGVTTNGSLLRGDMIKRLAATRPFNVNISVDAPVASVHDGLRGRPGLFDTIAAGIGPLRRECEALGGGVPIVVKPTVTAENFRLLPELVTWAVTVGATAVNLQPLEDWGPPEIKDLWIKEADMADFEAVVARLIAMKRDGAPILTDEGTLSLFPAHFRHQKAPSENLPCRVGLKDLFIMPNGEARLCFYFPQVGNLALQDARELWRGPLARSVRRDTIRCRRLCLLTCTSQKTLAQRARMALTLLRPVNRRDGNN